MSFENHILHEDAPVVVTRAYKDSQRQHLEHSLATAFMEMQRSFKVEERQRCWFECLRLCAELEKLHE